MYVANSNSNKQYCSIIGPITYNYPILILNVNISSFAKKVVHYFNVASFSCYVQWSHLVDRRNHKSKQLTSWLPSKYCGSIMTFTILFNKALPLGVTNPQCLHNKYAFVEFHQASSLSSCKFNTSENFANFFIFPTQISIEQKVKALHLHCSNNCMCMKINHWDELQCDFPVATCSGIGWTHQGAVQEGGVSPLPHKLWHY